jgi:competence protein ComGC
MRTTFLIQVYRLRLLGDYHHSTRIAFVEFVMVIASFSLLLVFFIPMCSFSPIIIKSYGKHHC